MLGYGTPIDFCIKNSVYIYSDVAYSFSPGINNTMVSTKGASHIFFLGLAVQVTVGFRILIAVSYTIYVMIPCLIDRLLYNRINNLLLSTMVYPIALIVIQLLLSFIEALGTVLTRTVKGWFLFRLQFLQFFTLITHIPFLIHQLLILIKIKIISIKNLHIFIWFFRTL
jgi:hypothetical protein